MDFTIIITASFSPIYPDITYIKSTIESLKYIESCITNNINVLLAHDHLNPLKHFNNLEIYNKNKDIYNTYFDNLENYVQNYNKNSKFFILEIIKNNNWGHLTGNIRNVIERVNTKYLLILQHDLPFCKKINIISIIEDMKNNSKLKHIQFSRYDNINYGYFKDLKFINKYNIKTQHNNYVSVLAWADQNHITTKDYYTNIVLKECNDGCFMEAILHKKNKNLNTHKKYGTYFFGEYNNNKFTNHISGKNAIYWNTKYKVSK